MNCYENGRPSMIGEIGDGVLQEARRKAISALKAQALAPKAAHTFHQATRGFSGPFLEFEPELFNPARTIMHANGQLCNPSKY